MLKIACIAAFFVLALSSCNENYGNKLESKELDVYFERLEDENMARKLGVFWKENDLLGSTKQYIRLDHDNGEYLLSLIVKDTSQVKGMSFDERKALLDLQKKIQTEIMPNKSLRLVLCNNQFKPLYDINQ